MGCVGILVLIMTLSFGTFASYAQPTTSIEVSETLYADCSEHQVESVKVTQDVIAKEQERIQKEKEEAERKEAERLAAEEAAEEAAKSQENLDAEKTTVVGSGHSILTKSGGVNYFKGQKETYYSEHVLPGGGLNIPGRHVSDDGTIRDQEGYVVVALPSGNKGEIVETSLGLGKCYDMNAGGDSIDIYTSW